MSRRSFVRITSIFAIGLLAWSGVVVAQEIGRPQRQPASSQPTGTSQYEPGTQQPEEPRAASQPRTRAWEPPPRRGAQSPPSRPGSQPVRQPAVSRPPGGGGSTPPAPPMRQPLVGPSQPVSSEPPARPPKFFPPTPGVPLRWPPPQPPIVAPGWPIRRALNPVTVRPRYDDRHRGDYRFRRPLIFLPLVVFNGILIDDWGDYDWRDRLLWEDAITIYDDEGWVEFTLDCGARGERVWIEVRNGRGRIDWAEIVFENGEVQVVEFADRSLGPGLYGLLDFGYSRRVDYVRMSARASTREMRLILRLER